MATDRREILLLISAFLLVPLPRAFGSERTRGALIVAQQSGPPDDTKKDDDDDNDDDDDSDSDSDKKEKDESPEARMNRRFPQKVRVGDLIGLPVLDDDDVTLGDVQKVVRTPQGKIKLIVSYSKWFGWFGRPVAVPIEVVTILGRQLDSVDMKPAEYVKVPTWMPGTDQVIPDSETIRVALGRR